MRATRILTARVCVMVNIEMNANRHNLQTTHNKVIVVITYRMIYDTIR